jgi:hypothetical protein
MDRSEWDRWEHQLRHALEAEIHQRAPQRFDADASQKWLARMRSRSLRRPRMARAGRARPLWSVLAAIAITLAGVGTVRMRQQSMRRGFRR